MRYSTRSGTSAKIFREISPSASSSLSCAVKNVLRDARYRAQLTEAMRSLIQKPKYLQLPFARDCADRPAHFRAHTVRPARLATVMVFFSILASRKSSYLSEFIIADRLIVAVTQLRMESK